MNRSSATDKNTMATFRQHEKCIRFSNTHMGAREIRKFCPINSEGDALLQTAITRLGLSARAYDRILKVSRTIADLDDSDYILPVHLSEAIQYRSLDRDFTGMV